MTITDITQVMIMANAILSESSGKPSEIDRLSVRVAQLTQSFDSWNRWMLWGLGFAAFAAVWIGLTTRLTIVRSKQLAVAQGELDAAKEARLSLELREKDAGIAKAQADASDAMAAQQQVEIELDRQQAKTAALQMEAADALRRQANAEEQLAKVQKKQQPRSVPLRGLGEAFKEVPFPPGGKIVMKYTEASPETAGFADLLWGVVFRDLGAPRPVGVPVLATPSGRPVQGSAEIRLLASDIDKNPYYKSIWHAFEAMRAMGYEGGLGGAPDKELAPDTVWILIGPKS